MYLLYTTVTQNFGVCPTNGCQAVGSSEYAYFLGLPVAFWGLGYYCVLFLTITQLNNEKRFPDFMKYLGILIVIGILFTLYLRYIEFFVIEAICFWCWGSVIAVALLAIAYIMLWKRK